VVLVVLVVSVVRSDSAGRRKEAGRREEDMLERTGLGFICY
jgi:hypothetical protein